MALKHKGEHVDLTFPNQNLNYSFFHLNATTGGTWTLVYSVKVLTPHPDCRTSLIGKRKQTHCQVHLKGNVIAAWITLNEQYLKVFCRTYEDMLNRFKACMTKINLPRTDKSLSRFHFSGSWVFTGIISLHPHWFTFCSVWCLKTSLEICFTVGWKCHISPPDVLSLSTFLPLSMSHQECHQPPLRLMPVNMAPLLSARSLLLSLLFALTLDEFIKEKKKANGRK